MQSCKKMTGESGLSLVEVLGSLTIAAIVSLAITTMLTTALHVNGLAKERSVATSLAAERMQRLTAWPMQTAPDYALYGLPEETADAGPPQTFTTDYGSIAGYEGYRRVVELNYDTPTAGMLTVKTTVSWRHVGQHERSHELIEFLHPALE